MLIVKLTIITSFVVLGYVQTGAAEKFTIDKYLGTWYDVLVIRHEPNQRSIISCQQRKVVIGDEGNIEENFEFTMRKRRITMTGTVTVANSVMRMEYSKHGDGGTMIYEVTSYNNGNDLILRDMTDKFKSVLVSHHPEENEISSEAKTDFEKIIAEVGGYVGYINNNNCSDNLQRHS